METNEMIGEMIKELRMDRGLMQRDAARDLRLSQNMLCHYEKGRRTIHFPMLVKIARYYGTSLEHFAEAIAGKADPPIAHGEPCEYCKPKYYEYFSVVLEGKYCPNCGRRLDKEESE